MVNRDDFASCPHDGSGLEPTPDDRRLSCGTCQGVLVVETTLLETVASVLAHHDAPKELPFEPGKLVEATYKCPRCEAAMTKHALYGIQVDRCSQHGVWFDRGELQSVLEKAGIQDVPGMPLSQKLFAGLTLAGYIAINIARFLGVLVAFLAIACSSKPPAKPKNCDPPPATGPMTPAQCTCVGGNVTLPAGRPEELRVCEMGESDHGDVKLDDGRIGWCCKPH